MTRCREHLTSPPCFARGTLLCQGSVVQMKWRKSSIEMWMLREKCRLAVMGCWRPEVCLSVKVDGSSMYSLSS